MNDAIYNVEATALFYTRPQPDMGDLLLDLNARLSEGGGCHLTVSPLSNSDWWLLTCDSFHVMVSFGTTPAQRDFLDHAVRSPVNGLNRFDYGQAVETHRAHVQIEVGDGSAPLPPQARVIMQEFGPSKICDPALKLMVLHWVTQFIGQNQGFLALHFGPSDRLFCPEEVAAASHEDVPETLLTHPEPSLPVEGPGGTDGYGLTLRNPRHLSGPAFELEGIPVKVPLATAVALMDTLRSAFADGNLVLDHGRVLRPSDRITLYVRETMNDIEHPHGRFILSFWDDRGHDAPIPKPEAPVATAPARIKKPTSPLKRAAREVITSPVEDSTLARTAQALEDTAAQRMEEDAAPTDTAFATGSLPAWLVAKFRSIPMERRFKAAGVAMIFGLPFLWNPYGNFTGGVSLEGPQMAGATTNPHEDSGPSGILTLALVEFPK